MLSGLKLRSENVIFVVLQLQISSVLSIGYKNVEVEHDVFFIIILSEIKLLINHHKSYIYTYTDLRKCIQAPKAPA